MSRDAVAAFPRKVAGNPYCDLLYDHLADLGVEVVEKSEFSLSWLIRSRREVRVLHLHWPEYYYRGAGARITARSLVAFSACVLIARAIGYRIVWTVHNALPHEAHPVDRLMRWLLLRVATPVVHSPAARQAIAWRRIPPVIPHGSYVGCYPDTIGRDEARRRLDLPTTGRVLLCFGQVRGYKGLGDLVQAFRGLADPSLRLVVAGRPATVADAEGLRQLAGGDPRIRLHLRYVADEDVQVFFRAADFVVLPYRNVLTSGAAMLALSFARPLVLPRLGCLEDLATAGCAIDYDPDDPEGLAGALERAAAADPIPLVERALAVTAALDWNDIATAYARVYGIVPRRPAREPEPVRLSA